MTISTGEQEMEEQLQFAAVINNLCSFIPLGMQMYFCKCVPFWWNGLKYRLQFTFESLITAFSHKRNFHENQHDISSSQKFSEFFFSFDIFFYLHYNIYINSTFLLL